MVTVGKSRKKNTKVSGIETLNTINFFPTPSKRKGQKKLKIIELIQSFGV